MLDKDLQRKLEQVDIMESQLYRQSILSPDDYQDMLKYAEVLYQTAKPKALFADAVSTSNKTILVGDLAKILKQNGVNIGSVRLFRWLREHGYLIRRDASDHNMPTQKSMERKLFKVKETVITHADGHTTISKTPKVTGKGQVYFVNKFLKSTNPDTEQFREKR